MTTPGDRPARPTIPETLAEALTPSWLSAALGSRFPGIEVHEVTPGPVVSRLSTNARFTIRTAGDAPTDLPTELCLKGYFGEAGLPARRAGVTETLFYRDVADSTEIRTLKCLYADLDESTSANVVITEDAVARGGTFLDSLSEYTPDQAAQSLAELAALHASTWMSPSIEQTPWLTPWLPALGTSRGLAEISTNFDGPIGAGIPTARRDGQRLLDAYAVLAADATTASPWSLIHADPHIANVFLDGEGRPSFVDWQLVQRGPWYIDVGYHLASALTVEDRRRNERELVRHYLDRLAAAGVQPPGEDAAWQDLRRGLVHGFYLWAITLKVDPPITTALLERLGTAMDDHDAFRGLA